MHLTRHTRPYQRFCTGRKTIRGRGTVPQFGTLLGNFEHARGPPVAPVPRFPAPFRDQTSATKFKQKAEY
eukprot:1634993-Rhodomonas_salina.1